MAVPSTAPQSPTSRKVLLLGLLIILFIAVYSVAWHFVAEFLREERVLLVQGTGFNWPNPDHFRLVFLPHEDQLREAIGRFARFLEVYRKRNGT